MALTNFKIRSASTGNKLHDGSGLYLTLSARGRGKWTMRFMMNQKAREIGLGPYAEHNTFLYETVTVPKVCQEKMQIATGQNEQ